MKKYLFTTMLFLLLPMFMMGQTLDVQKKDGTIEKHSISDISSITFRTEMGCDSSVTYKGKTYKTVQIGSQCWFKENLDVGTMIQSDGSHILQQQTDNGIIEKYCYDNDINNCDAYGAMYEWHEAMQYTTEEGAQGICPIGWHIPTKGEFEVLKSYVKEQAIQLIDESQAMGDGSFATNQTGFSALFAGYRDDVDGSFIQLGSYAFFWGSTEATNKKHAGEMYLYNNVDSKVELIDNYKTYGFYIRCLKN